MVDYKEVIADLQRRKAILRRDFDREIAELEAAIAAIEKMVPETLVVIAKDTAMNTGPYVGMTIRNAARRCLESHGKPMKTKALADALLAGGFRTGAKNFSTTVYGTLTRDAAFRVKDGVWSLVPSKD